MSLPNFKALGISKEMDEEMDLEGKVTVLQKLISSEYFICPSIQKRNEDDILL